MASKPKSATPKPSTKPAASAPPMQRAPRAPLTIASLKKRLTTARAELTRVSTILANTRPDHPAVPGIYAAAGAVATALAHLADVPDTEACVGLATRQKAPKVGVGVKVQFRQKRQDALVDLGRAVTETFKVVKQLGEGRSQRFVLESSDNSGFRVVAPGGHLKGIA